MLSVDNKQNNNELIIIMGVSGSGKSSIAQKIAKKSNYLFVEADDFHSLKSKEWMASGKPLTNKMREPWILSIKQYLETQLNNNVSCVLSYSGLIKCHRDKFREISIKKQFLFLDGSESLIGERLAKRENHFFNASLLHSQFTALEKPTYDEKDINMIDISGTFTSVLERCMEILNYTKLIN